MKKVVFVFLFSILLLGCSKNDQEGSNELTASNQALAPVILNFRGNTYTLAVGESKTISNVPNGTYDYETAVGLPAGATSISEGAHLTETLTFTGETKYNLFYVGSLDATGLIYKIGATLSTSNQADTGSRLLNLF